MESSLKPLSGVQTRAQATSFLGGAQCLRARGKRAPLQVVVAVRRRELRAAGLEACARCRLLPCLRERGPADCTAALFLFLPRALGAGMPAL